MWGFRIDPDFIVIFKFSIPALGLHPPDSELPSEGAGQGRRPQEPLRPSTARQAARPTGGEVKAGSSRDDGQGDITAAGKREQAHHTGETHPPSSQEHTHTSEWPFNPHPGPEGQHRLPLCL